MGPRRYSHHDLAAVQALILRFSPVSEWSHTLVCSHSSPVLRVLCKKRDNVSVIFCRKSFGILVLLGYDVTAFTPAAYLRSRLLRPSMEISS